MTPSIIGGCHDTHKCVTRGEGGVVTGKGTSRKTIRVDDETWDEYGKVCEQEKTTRSDDLRAHMKRKITNSKRRGMQ